MTQPIDAILVPQGAEYKAVCRGLSLVQASREVVPTPPVLPIPVGPKPLSKYLQDLLRSSLTPDKKKREVAVLLMGLCGSLTPSHSVGDVVLYQSCVWGSDIGLQMQCASSLTTVLYRKLKERATLVKALTSDRIIYSASEKRHLAQLYGVDVVDMEGFAVLEVLSQAGLAVAMIRVISDSDRHDIPDLNSALTLDGSLSAMPLAIAMLRQPIAATRLIRGALRGLKVLQKVTTLVMGNDH